MTNASQYKQERDEAQRSVAFLVAEVASLTTQANEFEKGYREEKAKSDRLEEVRKFQWDVINKLRETRDYQRDDAQARERRLAAQQAVIVTLHSERDQNRVDFNATLEIARRRAGTITTLTEERDSYKREWNRTKLWLRTAEQKIDNLKGQYNNEVQRGVVLTDRLNTLAIEKRQEHEYNERVYRECDDLRAINAANKGPIWTERLHALLRTTPHFTSLNQLHAQLTTQDERITTLTEWCKQHKKTSNLLAGEKQALESVIAAMKRDMDEDDRTINTLHSQKLSLQNRLACALHNVRHRSLTITDLQKKLRVAQDASEHWAGQASRYYTLYFENVSGFNGV